MAILDQYGNPIKRSTPPKRRLPVSPVRKSNRDYIIDGLTPEKIGPVFRRADRGDVDQQAQLFEQLMEHDLHVLSEERKRVNAIESPYITWNLTPASDSQRDLDVVEFVRKNMLQNPGWIEYKKAQQSAVGFGYAGLAPEWDRSEGQAVAGNFDFIAHKDLIFSDPRTGFLRDWPLLSTDDHPEGEELHQDALFLHKHGGLSRHSTRSGVFRPITWMVIFKHFAVRDWWVFSELCGIPLRLGIYQSGANKDDVAQLEEAVLGIGTDFAAVISANTKIEFQEAAKSISGSQLWEIQTTFCNNEISKGMVGSAAFSEAGKSGSYALHTLETGVRADLTLSDAKGTAATDLNQWIAPLVYFNFGPDTPLPGFRAEFKKQEDLKLKSEWLELVADRAGRQIPLKWYLDQYNIPAAVKGEKTVDDIRPANGNAALAAKLILAKAKLDKGYPPEQQALENHVDALVSATYLSANEDAMLAFVAAYEGELEDLPEALLGVWPQLDMESLRSNLETSLVNANLHGRRVVQIDKEQAE